MYKLALMALLIACTQKTSPESFLKNYMFSRYGKVVEKEYILANATGDFLNEVSAVEGEDLTKLLDLKKFSLLKVQIHNKECGESSCTISYTIKYKQEKDTIHSKKIVELSQENDVWKIARVNNVKTFIESSEIVK